VKTKSGIGVFLLDARHPGEGRDPVHAVETPLDAGCAIPDTIRDRHDHKNSPTAELSAKIGIDIDARLTPPDPISIPNPIAISIRV